MRTLRKTFDRPARKIDYERASKGSTIPDQSMSIETIIKRYVKGAPVDVNTDRGVYLDQNEYDFEKLSRQDFDDKHEFARLQQARAADIEAELKERAENEKRSNETATNATNAQNQRSEKAREGDTGIDSLDNTMPVDTALSNRQLQGKKK
jgi:hypothetical protein